MKYKLDYRIKIALICILIITSILSALLAAKEYFVTEYSSEKFHRFSFEDTANIKCNSYMIENDIYEEEVINNNVVIGTFVDHFEIEYQYDYKSDIDMKTCAKGSIIVAVEGYLGQNEEHTTIFIKEFDNIEIQKTIIGSEGLFGSIDINYNQLNSFIKNLFEKAEIGCNARINVLLNLDITVDNQFKKLSFESKPYIYIPLNSSFIEVSGEQIIKNSEKYEELIKKEVPVNRTKIIILTIIGLAFLVIAYIIFKMVEMQNKPDKQAKVVNKIFKQFGSFMVKLNQNINFDDFMLIGVKNIDDLARLSDELRKPIFYQDEFQIKNISEFYLIDNNTLYIYKIEVKQEESELTVV